MTWPLISIIYDVFQGTSRTTGRLSRNCAFSWTPVLASTPHSSFSLQHENAALETNRRSYKWEEWWNSEKKKSLQLNIHTVFIRCFLVRKCDLLKKMVQKHEKLYSYLYIYIFKLLYLYSSIYIFMFFFNLRVPSFKNYVCFLKAYFIIIIFSLLLTC